MSREAASASVPSSVVSSTINAPEVMLKGGLSELSKWGGPLTDAQQKAVEQAERFLKAPQAGGGKSDGGTSGLLAVQVVDVLGQTKANPVIAFYAAATAVMFLLFSCAHGAGGYFTTGRLTLILLCCFEVSISGMNLICLLSLSSFDWIESH
jgi:hypothetical protein